MSLWIQGLSLYFIVVDRQAQNAPQQTLVTWRRPYVSGSSCSFWLAHPTEKILKDFQRAKKTVAVNMCCSYFMEKKESSLPGVSHRRETMMFLQRHREASVSGELSTLATRTSLIPTVITSCQMQKKEAWWGVEWGRERRILTKLKMKASWGFALELGSHLGTWAVLDSGEHHCMLFSCCSLCFFVLHL